ncbi:MAG TPA: radical SAM protein [Planctomycetota bacterium]|nr:radical SAM protein [Planctomycetota bacterium]
MGIISKLKDAFLVNRQDSIIFEVTQKCNNDCLFCYNAWKADKNYPQGELSTAETKGLIRRIVKETSCKQLTFTGGEPFLRADLPELITCAKELGVAINIISNGTLITEDIARDYIKLGVGLFELPLLSAERTTHDALSRNQGAFDKVVESVANIKLHRGRVVTVFVGTKRNIDGLKEMIELSLAIGADGIMFNRFNVGGEGIRHIDELLPTPAQVIKALETIESAMDQYKIGISCSIPIQPCIIDTSRFKKVHFGYCAAGTKRAYYTVDPMGNLRMCNHTPSILGNILKSSFKELTTKQKIKPFMDAVPEFCKDCQMVKTCQGGCKAAAEVSSAGCSLCAEEPFLKKYKNEWLKKGLAPLERASVAD